MRCFVTADDDGQPGGTFPHLNTQTKKMTAGLMSRFLPFRNKVMNLTQMIKSAVNAGDNRAQWGSQVQVSAAGMGSFGVGRSQ